MKKPEEYLENVDWSDKWFWDIEAEVEVIIKQVQTDAYNQALEDAAKNAYVNELSGDEMMKTPGFITFFEVSKESILKLKKRNDEES